MSEEDSLINDSVVPVSVFFFFFLGVVIIVNASMSRRNVSENSLNFGLMLFFLFK